MQYLFLVGRKERGGEVYKGRATKVYEEIKDMEGDWMGEEIQLFI